MAVYPVKALKWFANFVLGLVMLAAILAFYIVVGSNLVYLPVILGTLLVFALVFGWFVIVPINCLYSLFARPESHIKVQAGMMLALWGISILCLPYLLRLGDWIVSL